METVKLVFPHQLFQDNPLFAIEGSFCMVEEVLFFKQYKFHKRKLAYHRATMKFYEQYLHTKDFAVKYIGATEPEADIRVLLETLRKTGVQSIAMVDPVDDWLCSRVKSSCKKLQLELEIVTSPMFLNTPLELSNYFKPSRQKFFQTEFYKQERIRRNILLDPARGPVGGKWSFDEDNRKRYPKGKAVIKTHFPPGDEYTQEAYNYVNEHFAGNPGALNVHIKYPVDYDESEKWLDEFLQHRFIMFGDYEDAIVHKEMLLHHSLLTPMLNVGLITPAKVLEKALKYSMEHGIPINSLEGFIRQIMGWREFIRAVYIKRGREQRTRNYWQFTRKIPASFYNGSTGILPVDETIKKILQTGYCHHIERLMVLGNFMLLCEIDPDEVYRWFMELFIDAYDWVMVPNVYGMSQFADGGIMSTKPYISGSNYLMKMGDYPKGDWQEIWDALFWRFLDVHRTFFLQNPRLSMLVRSFDKWDELKKTSMHERAMDFLKSLDATNS